MKNIAAAVFLSVGLFCLFSENAQAQRARWSGNGANDGYNFKINLNVTDRDLTVNGFYPEAVDEFTYQLPESDGKYVSFKGDLRLYKYSEQQIKIDMEFNNEYPVLSSYFQIKPDSDVDFKDVNVNDLEEFFEQLSKIKFSIDDSAPNEIIFTDLTREPDTYQSFVNPLEIDRTPNVSVPEPNLGYSSLFLLPFSALYLRRRKRLKGAKMIQTKQH